MPDLTDEQIRELEGLYNAMRNEWAGFTGGIILPGPATREFNSAMHAKAPALLAELKRLREVESKANQAVEAWLAYRAKRDECRAMYARSEIVSEIVANERRAAALQVDLHDALDQLAQQQKGGER